MNMLSGDGGHAQIFRLKEFEANSRICGGLLGAH